MDQPQDYNLPHDEWRPHQKEALDLVLNMHNPSTLILEMPTGSGKTALAAAAATQAKVLSMVATRDLQQQYSDIYDFDVIWGRSHYPCGDEVKARRWLKNYGISPTADDCPDMKTCKYDCPYKEAKSQAAASDKAVMNYHYAWFSEWWHTRGGYLFADEAHNLAITTISNLAQLRVSERTRHNWGLPKFPACSGTTQWAKDLVSEWLDKAQRIVGDTIKDMEEGKAKSKGTLFRRKLLLLNALLLHGEWHISGSNYGNVNNPPHLACRPINSHQFASRLLGYHNRKILMSATIGDPEMLACELGIDKYQFHSFPHNIPQSQRPVYLMDAPGMSYKSTYKDYERQADIIAYICLKHKYDRILIHVTRWRHAHDLRNRLARKGLADRVWVPDQKVDRMRQMAKLLDGRYDNLIAIGPSFWEGLDLRGDLCRVIIVAKVPFQDRKDPVVATRLRQEGGMKWDFWVAALKVTQGCGRAVRDETDYATAYICDSNWTRVARYAPQWFEVEG